MAEDLTALSADELAARLETYNDAYRRGEPLISDAQYDALVEHLRILAPQHSFLKVVEPELFSGKRPVRHPAPMLSTEKAYTVRDLEMFLARVHKKAAERGVATVRYRATAKLDGLAGRDDGLVLCSRGDGMSGYDITAALEKGVKPLGGRGLGLGEIVIRQSYFDDHLAGSFEHPRNLVVGIVSSDTVNPEAQQALDDGAVHFVPYAGLNGWTGTGEQLAAGIDEIYDRLTRIDYPTDGLVVEVTDPALRDAMGATTHHYRWQIAYKRRGETAVTTVEAVTWQVGRTGSVTPVMEVAPVSLSGATIRRVTAHNAGKVQKDGIGTGARIEIIRSGEVIPKIERVLAPSDRVDLPSCCPSCQTPLDWEDPFLRCPNSQGCRDQIVQRIRHWFHTLGNADWFGVKTVERLVDAGRNTLAQIYDMTGADYEALGFGPGQSANLVQAVALSRSQPLEDWRFLAAFGLPHLGTGDSRRLLQAIPLELLLDADAEQIARVYGFAQVTSRAIAGEIAVQSMQIGGMRQRGFNLERSRPVAVDFLITIGLFEDIAGDGAARATKEKNQRRQVAAAALLRRWNLAELCAVGAEDLEAHAADFPFTVADRQAVAVRLARYEGRLRQAAALPLEWVYPPAEAEDAPDEAFSGKGIVFSGKMAGGSREQMQVEARRRGMVVQSAVSGKTDYLVCGEKVGAAKLKKAHTLGVMVISEAEYRQLLNASPEGG